MTVLPDTLLRRVARILATDGVSHVVRFVVARDLQCSYAHVSPDTWPAPHIACEAARSFMSEDWCGLVHTTSGAWVADIGSDDESSCVGEGRTAEEAVIALWEDLLGLQSPESP